MKITEEDRDRINVTANIIAGVIAGDGTIGGRMASGAEGAIDPSLAYQRMAEVFQGLGMTTQEEIAAELLRRREANTFED